MNQIRVYLDRLVDHSLKEIPSGPGIQAYFAYRSSTTTDAFNFLVFKGVIYLSAPDHGALTLMPFAPDALGWLSENAHNPDALLEAIPQNLVEIVTGEQENEDGSIEVTHHDSIDFFLAAAMFVNRMLRASA